MRRLALLPAEPLTEDALEKNEPAYLKIPVTSVKGWAAYVRALANLFKRPPLGVVTEVFTRPDPKTQFRVLFRHVSDLPDRLVQTVLARAEEIRQSIAFPYPEPNALQDAANAKQRKPRKY